MEEDGFYIHPDEMLEASIPKRNYSMNRQLILFDGAVHRAIHRGETMFSLDNVYQYLRAVIPQNLTVNSLQMLREVVKNAPRLPQLRATRRFFRSFFEFLSDLQRLGENFKDRIYSVLLEFYFDTSFIQLRDLQAKKSGLVKDQGLGLSPELVREVGELCRQLLLNIEGLADTLTTWQELLKDSEIDPNFFDENSAHSIQQFRDCTRFQHILRLVPDVLNKSQMSVVLAKAWWYKADKIRRKLAGNPSLDSGVSSCSEMETLSVASKSPPRLTKRQKAVANHPVPQQPSVSRKKKVKSLEEMDKERASYVQEQPPPEDSKEGQETLNQRPTVKKKPAKSKDLHNRSNAAKTDDQLQTNDDAKFPKPPATQPPKNNDKTRDPPASKSQRNAQPTDDEDTKIPLNQDEGTQKARKRRTKAKPEDTKKPAPMKPLESTQNEANEEPDFIGSTQDSMGALSLDQNSEFKDGDPRDSGPLSWQEQKLERLRYKLERLIEAKETQKAALKLLAAMKDNLAQKIEKPMSRCSYRLKCRLQARVELLTKKAQGWKEETKSLDYNHKLLNEDLRLEIKMNGYLYRYIDQLQERQAYIDVLVAKERTGIDQLSEQLRVLKENAEHMHYYGMNFDFDYDDYDLQMGPWEGDFDKYQHRAFGAGHYRSRPYFQFLRDEELLLGGSLRSSYERSLWNALKSEPVEALPFMESPEDSFDWPPRLLRAGGYMGGRGRKDRGNGYRGDDDYSSDSDGDGDERQRGSHPQMYDQKRDDKQPPDFVPV